MKKSATIAALAAMSLALAACGGSETDEAKEAEAAAADADAAAAPAPEAAPAAATAPAAGTYEVFKADGSADSTTEIRADGGYTTTPVKGLATSGVVKMVDGKTCFDPSGKEEATCYQDSAPGADGSFTSKMDDGTVLTVKPKKAEAAM